MLRKGIHIVIVCLTVIMLASCAVKRHIPEGQHFLDKNSIVIKNEKNVRTEFKKSDLSAYITQSPHKVRFPFKFPTWLYYVTENKTGKFWRWVNGSVARTPEYFDAEAAYNSARQIEQYLDNRGYFHSKVSYSTKPKSSFQWHRLKATYTVIPSEPYTISNINYRIEDTLLKKDVMRIESRFPTKVNDIYNAYNLDEQRNTITEYLRNMGYYYFNKDYISYEVDSSFNNHTLEITMVISNVKDRNSNTYHPHKKYTINAINIYPNYMPSLANVSPTDSATINFPTGFRNARNTLHFYFHEKPRVKPSTFKQIIQIYQGRPYRQRGVELTYSAMSSLKMFANASIEFDTVPTGNDSLNLLNCNILLRRTDVNSIKLQTEATNSGGDLGISGSITYSNKNIFKGAEVLSISIKGGLEAQKVIDISDIGEENSIFNTSELILNTNLFIPRFLSPIPLRTFVRDYQPRTTVSLGGSAQVRYAYSRYIAMSSVGYDWKASPRLQYVLTPVYLNYVKVNPIPEFQAILDLESNQRIKDQYTNHLIFGGRYSFIYNTQNVNRSSNYIYLRGNLESSGGILSTLNRTKIITENDDHHELMGIRYAQYLRGDIDFRQYLKLGEKTWFVCRQLIGFGIPYGNSYDMPFERSFYSGGSTGMRGWNYRKLGPGAYIPDDSFNVERIGDIQLECNAELRFPIHGSVNGALFVDAGNIWNYHANELLPDGEFHFNTFYNQIAMDAGLGIRLDFKIAVLRIDLALPIRYPYANAEGKHWHFDEQNLLDLQWVFNIGYPF